MDNVKRKEKKYSSYPEKGRMRVIPTMLVILLAFIITHYSGTINARAAEGDYYASVTAAGESVPTQYTSLSSAIDAAKTMPGSTVKLLQNATINGITLNSGTFTIDLNGKEWRSSYDYANTLKLLGDTKITIKDSLGGGYICGSEYSDSISLESTNASVSLQGGKYDKIFTNASNIGDMLAEGYAYQNTNSKAWVTDLNVSLLENVTVQAIPVKITGQPVGDTLLINYQESKTLSVTAETVPAGSTKPISYLWYKNGTAMETEISKDYTIPLGLSAGTYEYYCAVTCDNYILNTQKVKIYVVNGTGQYTVTDANGTTNLFTLETAIEDAKSKPGSTLKFITNATTDSTVNIDSGTFTIDLNGNTWNSNVTDTQSSSIQISGSANVTLKDSKSGGKITSKTLRTITVASGLLTIENGSYENARTSGGYAVSSENTNGMSLKIKGGTFTSATTNYSAVYLFEGSALLSGGTYGSIYSSGGSPTQYLENGYGFKSADDTTWINTAPFKDVTVKQKPVKITTQPQNVSVNYGYTTQPTLNVEAESPAGVTGEISYQWYKNGTAIEGAKSASYKILPGLSAGDYVYSCDVTCEDTTLTTKEAKVTVATYKPMIEFTATPNNLKYNDSTHITVKVYGVNGEIPTGQMEILSFPVPQEGITLKQGDGYSYCEVTADNIPAGKYYIYLRYTPANDEIGKNYSVSVRNDITLPVAKIDQSSLSINEVGNKKYGDNNFDLSYTGGSGEGAVSYSVPDDKVLSINGNTATIVGAGTVTVTATKAADDNYNAATATYNITVAMADTTIKFNTSYPDTFTYTGTALKNPEASDLTLTIAKYSDVTFTWYKNSLSDENKLDQPTPTEVGTYILVANIQGTDNFNASSVSKTVTIEPVQNVTGLSLDSSALTLVAGGTPATLTATVTPSNATNKNLIWTSSDNTVAIVANGVITPLTQGSTTITVTAVDGGYTATCVVTVNAAPQLDCPASYYGYQFRSSANGNDIRLVATINTLDADEVGFVYSETDKAPAVGSAGCTLLPTKTVYSSIKVNNTKKTAADLGGNYIIVGTVNNITQYTSGTLYVRVYVKKGDAISYTVVKTLPLIN